MPNTEFITKSPMSNYETASSLSFLAICLLVGYTLARRTTQDVLSTETKIPRLRGYPFIGCSIDFFSRRNEFIQECLDKVKDTFCEIDMPKCRAIILTGEQARSAFFNHKYLSLENGYLLLHPKDSDWREIKGMPSTSSGADLPWFHSRFTAILRSQTLPNRYPTVTADIRRAHELMGPVGTVDPFELSHSIVLKLLIRIICPEDIANDPVQTECISALFGILDGETKALDFLLPWIPGLDSLSKMYYGYKLYKVFESAVAKRTTYPSDDTDVIHYMMEKGDGPRDMISFFLGAIFAGLVNTSRVHAWVLIILHSHPRWKAKVINEINALLTAHNATLDRISNVPLEAWETDLPIMESCILEIIRLLGGGALLRQNIGENFKIEDRTIPSGAYLIYPMSDVHHNASLHSSPDNFNPSRPYSGSTSDFVGFGAGRHPCIGRRVALLLTKLLTAHFLLRYDYQVVDDRENVLRECPRAELNSLHMPRLAGAAKVKLLYAAV